MTRVLMATSTTVSYIEKPSSSLSKQKCLDFIHELREVTALALGVEEGELPDYQCLSLKDPIVSLSDKVVVCARTSEGKLVAFSSAVLLPIPPLQNPVLHLGLTCILPSSGSLGLTKTLIASLLREYERSHPIVSTESKLWVSNLASVISSLGNVARLMEEVYPSPKYPEPPTQTHQVIARSITSSPELREAMYILPEAIYDEHCSVVKGSAKGTVFGKMSREKIENGRHRDSKIDAFYRSRINFERGDEVLQVASFSSSLKLQADVADQIKTKL